MTVADVDDFLRVLRDHPEWRERVRLEILGEEILSLPERVSAVERQLELLTIEVREGFVSLRRNQESMQRSIEALERSQESMQRSLEALQRSQESMHAAITELTNRHGGRLDNLDGQLYEMRYTAIGRVGERYRRAQRVYIGDIEEVLDARDDGRLTPQQVAGLRAADFIVRARNGKGPDAPPIFVVIEVSITIHDRDVQRAAERAAALRAVGLDAVGWVGGKTIAQGAALLAERLDVAVLLDSEDSNAA
jgi:predicted RNase H-like nuclease (RuvC/YqgF family)